MKNHQWQQNNDLFMRMNRKIKIKQRTKEFEQEKIKQFIVKNKIKTISISKEYQPQYTAIPNYLDQRNRRNFFSIWID